MITISKPGIIFLLVLIFSILLSICYILSYYLTLYISSILFLLLTCYLIRTLITLLIFPGSYKFWQRLIESHYCKELSDQACQKLKSLSTYLNSLKNPNRDTTFSENSVRLFQKLITTLINNFSYLEQEELLTSDQNILLSKLSSLRSLLFNTQVILSEDFESNLWDLIENPDPGAGIKDMSALDSCIMQIENISEFIRSRSNRSFLRGGYLLGSVEYMRADLFKRFVCEQFWVQGEDSLIDCVWISGIISTESSPVIIFCNPNAAYYEYSYFQTDWIELYVMSGVNLVLWNYRGYGRSTGKPDIEKMKKDAENVGLFVKSRKKVIGVHGESLGGNIAVHLANKIKANFLFADRTFKSLRSTARHSYGSFAELLLKIFGPKDSDIVQDFIESDCFKIISCDCNDFMIHDLGSLKTGVAVKYFSQHPCKFPLTQSETTFTLESMRKIQKIGNYIKSSDRALKKIKKRGSIDSGNLLKTLTCYLNEILVTLDAGGQSFMDLFVESNAEQLRSWVCVLGLWGSTPEVYSNLNSNNIQSALAKFKLGTAELRSIIEEYQKSNSDEVHLLLKDFKVILEFLEKCQAWLGDVNANERITGKLLPLTCGHNGSFNSLERFLYEQYLQTAGIF